MRDIVKIIEDFINYLDGIRNAIESQKQNELKSLNKDINFLKKILSSATSGDDYSINECWRELQDFTQKMGGIYMPKNNYHIFQDHCNELYEAYFNLVVNIRNKKSI